jgi:hypothetical protein
MIISHRGNLDQSSKTLENTPEALALSVLNNIDIELDIWYENNKFYLGHDGPQYEFDPIYYNYGIINVFYHCKTIKTYVELKKYFLLSKQIDLFMHDTDMAAITKNGLIWTYPGKELHKDSIAVMPELINIQYLDEVIQLYRDKKIKGICSDYILEINYFLQYATTKRG